MKIKTLLSIFILKLTDNIICAGNRIRLFNPKDCVLMSLLKVNRKIINKQ